MKLGRPIVKLVLDFQAAAEQGDLAATDEAFLTYCMRFAIA